MNYVILGSLLNGKRNARVTENRPAGHGDLRTNRKFFLNIWYWVGKDRVGKDVEVGKRLGGGRVRRVEFKGEPSGRHAAKSLSLFLVDCMPFLCSKLDALIY